MSPRKVSQIFMIDENTVRVFRPAGGLTATEKKYSFVDSNGRRGFVVKNNGSYMGGGFDSFESARDALARGLKRWIAYANKEIATMRSALDGLSSATEEACDECNQYGWSLRR